MIKKIKLATRKSELARAQCELVSQALKSRYSDMEVEEVTVMTSGDRKQGTSLANNGDKRDWIDGFEDALSSGLIDLAVHSGKDVPVELAEGLDILPVLERKYPFDVFIGRRLAEQTRLSFKDLPKGAKVGTASCRRKAELLNLRPDLEIICLRGNVPTRINSLDNGLAGLDGIVLAEAGIQRLNLSISYEVFSPDELLPSVNQGVLAIEFRSDNYWKSFCEVFATAELNFSFFAEREVIRLLGADCHSAVGVYAWFSDAGLNIKAKVFSSDGKEFVEASITGEGNRYLELAGKVVRELVIAGAGKYLGTILDECR